LNGIHDVTVAIGNAVLDVNVKIQAVIAAHKAVTDACEAAILAKTNLIPASPAAVGSAMTLDSATHLLITVDSNNALADANGKGMFDPNMSGVTVSGDVTTIKGVDADESIKKNAASLR
jgi:hypothetical protein